MRFTIHFLICKMPTKKYISEIYLPKTPFFFADLIASFVTVSNGKFSVLPSYVTINSSLG